jgi:hypothetical protein
MCGSTAECADSSDERYLSDPLSSEHAPPAFGNYFLKSGFSRAEISMVEGSPSVLAFNSLLHGMGLAYERLVNRYDFLSNFRLNIITVAYKN